MWAAVDREVGCTRAWNGALTQTDIEPSSEGSEPDEHLFHRTDEAQGRIGQSAGFGLRDATDSPSAQHPEVERSEQRDARSGSREMEAERGEASERSNGERGCTHREPEASMLAEG